MTPENWQKIKLILGKALTMPDEARRRFLEEECDDAAMLREVESLLEFENADVGGLEGSAISIVTKAKAANSTVGKKIGRYVIVSELGAGGMGSVFLATRADGEFTQKVALKLIKSGISSDFILKRFYSERQILASLDHPYIAHLIDGGTTDDDLPYFVMEYVEGESIVDYVRNHQIDLEGRLDLFRKICSGVAYAHQNLVIHRDLKPSNILVKKDGIPKLLDFGIAKLLKDNSDGETVTQQLAFTPEYASPEQIRGENLSTATDVYSLGVVLYELLTGVRPFKYDGKNFGQIVQTATETAPVRPSAADTLEIPGNDELKVSFSSTRLRGDLDNIVLKALNKDPTRRYSSVEKFSEDIRRHLQGLPVFARQDSWSYRAEKFARRNPLVVGSVAFAFVILVAGILATTFQANRANAERERAERRFNDVRKLANSFIFEINEKIAESPIEARELLVRRGLEYLDNLSAEAEGDELLQSELASAYQKIGNLQAELFNPSLGKTSEALLSQRKALEIRERLLSLDPTNKERILDSIQSRIDVANILSMSGNVVEARDEYKNAAVMGETALLSAKDDLKLRNSVARSYALLGQAVLRSGSLSGALENYELSHEIYKQIDAESPNVAHNLNSLAIISSYIAYVKLEMGFTADAIRYFDAAFSMTQRAIDLDPAKPGSAQLIIIPHLWLGVATSYEDPDKGLFHIRRALEMQQNVVNADRKNLGELNALADCYLELGRALKKKAEREKNASVTLSEAITAFQTAIKNYETVRMTDVENVSTLRQISFTRTHLGDIYAMLGKKNLAISAFERALAESEQVNQKDPKNSEFRHDLALNLSRLAENGINTEVNIGRAIGIFTELITESPEHKQRGADLEHAKAILAKYTK